MHDCGLNCFINTIFTDLKYIFKAHWIFPLSLFTPLPPIQLLYQDISSLLKVNGELRAPCQHSETSNRAALSLDYSMLYTSSCCSIHRLTGLALPSAADPPVKVTMYANGMVHLWCRVAAARLLMAGTEIDRRVSLGKYPGLQSLRGTWIGLQVGRGGGWISAQAPSIMCQFWPR